MTYLDGVDDESMIIYTNLACFGKKASDRF